MIHWTDSKIRIHLFCCVLALALAHLMRREAHHAGLDLSVRELLRTLGGIEETVLLYPTEKMDNPARNASSPTKTPPNSVCSSCSTSRPTHPDADMGNTPSQPHTPVGLHVDNLPPR